METQKMKKKRILMAVFAMVFIAMNIALITQTANAVYIPPSGHTFTCYGYVETMSGTPIYGATVKMLYGSPETGIYVTTTTDSNGYYYLTVQTSLYVNCKVQASKSGYYTEYVYKYSSGSYRVDFDLETMPHSFTCKGYIRHINGVGISGATVTISGTDNDKSTTTDAYGYYSISMTTSSYVYCTVTASADYFESNSKTVYSDGTQTANIYLTPIYTQKTEYTTINLWSNGFIFNYRHYKLQIKTIYYEDAWGEGYISYQRLKLYTTTEGFFCPGMVTFKVSYTGSDCYWKVYYPTKYDNHYLEISDSDMVDTDTHSGISLIHGQMYSHLRYHMAYYENGVYNDLGYGNFYFSV
jgi:hypothetical protein